jgi:hypothetical protein
VLSDPVGEVSARSVFVSVTAAGVLGCPSGG